MEYEDSRTLIQGFDDNDIGVYEVGDPTEDQPIDNDQMDIDFMDTEKLEPEFTYPTPASTPPAALLAGTISEKDGQIRHHFNTNFEPWKASFNAGTRVQP